MRLLSSVFFAFAVLFVLGCGSSTTSSSGPGGGGTTSAPTEIPVVTGLAPAQVVAGSPSTAVAVFGSNFEPGATIQWNGTSLSSVCVAADLMTSANCTAAAAVSASVPSQDFATAGTAKVTVSNPAPSGGASTALTFTVAAKTVTASTWVRAVAGLASPHDIVWDAKNAALYVSMAAADTSVPNTIAAVEPVSGKILNSAPAGNDPHLLSISSDAAYLWAALDGDRAIQRFNLPTLTKDIYVPVESGNYQAVALQAAPVSSHTLGIVAGIYGDSPTGGAVLVYDDATQRPQIGFPPTRSSYIDWMQWGKDDSVIYGTQYTTIDEGGITTLQVSPSGVSTGTISGVSLQPTITQFLPATGLLYSYGGAYNPVTSTLSGSFNLPTTGAETCLADSSLNRYFCLTTFSVGGTDITDIELWVFDLGSNALISRTYFGYTSPYTSSSIITGFPLKLARWGTSGLALATQTAVGYGNGGVFLIDGAVINATAVPDSSAGTAAAAYPALTTMTPNAASPSAGLVQVTINGSGFSPTSTACWNCSFIQLQLLPTTYISPTQLQVAFPVAALQANSPLSVSVFNQASNLFSQNALTFTVASPSSNTKITPINLCGLSMAWDAKSQLLYVGTADYDSFAPNSIVAINPAIATIQTSTPVGPDPAFLAESASGEFLYAAFAGSTNLTQLSLPNLNTTATAVLNGWQGGPYFPEDLKAAPINDHTTALTLVKPGFDPPALGGIVLLDDGVQRPNLNPDFIGPGTALPYFNTIAWSASDQLLTSAQNEVDSGPLFSLNLDAQGFTTATQGTQTFNLLGTQIHSDFGTGYIYSDDGNVADPTSGAIVGTYEASGLAVPDSSLNRTFFLGQTAVQQGTNSYTIQSFDQKDFAPVASITLPALSGTPFELIRWGKTGLAVLTSGGSGAYEDSFGTLYLVEDAQFVSDIRSTNSSVTSHSERVQQRWTRLSKKQIVDLNRRAAGQRSWKQSN